MTTIQDPVVLDEMIPLGISAIKVGSDDFDHVLNLEYYMKSGLPLILSNGMTDVKETNQIVDLLRKIIMHIILHFALCFLYPCEPSFINLYSIRDLRLIYPDFVWGFSDHTISHGNSLFSDNGRESIIEKHFRSTIAWPRSLVFS